MSPGVPLGGPIFVACTKKSFPFHCQLNFIVGFWDTLLCQTVRLKPLVTPQISPCVPSPSPLREHSTIDAPLHAILSHLLYRFINLNYYTVRCPQYIDLFIYASIRLNLSLPNSPLPTNALTELLLIRSSTSHLNFSIDWEIPSWLHYHRVFYVHNAFISFSLSPVMCR